MTALLTVVIPSADPRFLRQTVDDLYRNAAGPLQVIVSADGYDPQLPARDGLTVLVHERLGMRGALNAARGLVDGDWYMKCDEHCLFSPGFDEQLKADCDQNWVMIPRRYSLDADNWCIEDNPKGPRDQHYLSCPVWSIREKSDYSMHGLEWPERTRQLLRSPGALTEDSVQPTMSWQGSCYFMSRRHYDWLGPLEEKNWGSFAAEPQVVGLMTQLGGGQLMVNKRAYYAHLHKGRKYGRGYRPNKTEISAGHEFNAWYWMTGQWGGAVRSLESLVAEFWPVPGWPADILGNWGKYAPTGATLEQLKAAARG